MALRKTKLENLMYMRNITLKKINKQTGIAYPTLLNIKKGRKTDINFFRKRTIKDLEKFLECPAHNFIGWENKKQSNQNQKQITIENNITTPIKAEIEKHEGIISSSVNEISLLKTILKIYKGGKSESSEEETTSVKQKYVKSGKYSKKKKKSGRKQLSPDLRRIKWRPLILNAIKKQGKPMNTKQLIDALFKGRHNSTLKVVKRRMSVILSLYKKMGILKTNKNGRGLKYGTIQMFKKINS